MKKNDIVITDINMPRLNGLEMAKKILEFDDSIPIILNSAHNETKYFTEAIELNVDGYLLKPFSIDNLLNLLSRIVEKMQLKKDFNNSVQYQELTDSNTAVSKTDLNGVLTYVNDKFCKLSGYSKEELLGTNHNIVRHKDTPASEYTDLWHCIKHEKKQLYDFVESSIEPVLILIKIDEFLDIEKLYGYQLLHEIQSNFEATLTGLMPDYLGFDKHFLLGNGEYIFARDLEIVSEEFMQNVIEELKSLQYQVNELKIDVVEVEYDISIMVSISSGDKCIENVNCGMKSLEYSKQDFIVAHNLAQTEQEKAKNNLNVLRMVKKALEDYKIISYFQPIVCNTTQKIVKYESLVRLVDENSFKALGDTDKIITINISALDIEKPSTKEKIFELLEDDDVRDIEEISKFISEVKGYGVEIAIDDFGAGYYFGKPDVLS